MEKTLLFRCRKARDSEKLQKCLILCMKDKAGWKGTRERGNAHCLCRGRSGNRNGLKKAGGEGKVEQVLELR